MAKSSAILDALDRNKYEEARDLKIQEWHHEVGHRKSWDSPQYRCSRKVQSTLVVDNNRDTGLTYFGLETLMDRYVLRDGHGVVCETPQQFFARVATGVACGEKTAAEVDHNPRLFSETVAFAQELYDAISQRHAMFSTPILTNAGTNRGQWISCFLNSWEDSIPGIYEVGLKENSVLAAGGGGIGSYVGHIREAGSHLKTTGGQASGPIPFMKSFDSQCLAVTQSSTGRSGSGALYAPVWHPDVENLLEVRKPKGDVNRQCLNIHQGLVVDDKFMHAVQDRRPYALRSPHTNKEVRDLDAFTLMKKIIATRVTFGEPYMLFIDNVNNHQPLINRILGHRVETSNLCIEVVLITSFLKRVVPQKFLDYVWGRATPSGRTAVCCLASLNYTTFDQWKDHGARLVYLMNKALDNVLGFFIRNAGQGYERAVYSAYRGRDIGLGVMGWADHLQQRGIDIGSVLARSENKIRFKEFRSWLDASNQQLAIERGPAPDAVLASSFGARMVIPTLLALGMAGSRFFAKVARWLMPRTLVRNVNDSAIAPTASIGVIAGSSPSIEPYSCNSFNQKTLSGWYVVRNPNLVRLLETKYPEHNNDHTWSTIHLLGGSVQHLSWMDEQDKRVYRTAYEVNQRELVQQAADRQPFITQSQSLNLFFAPGPDKKLSSKYVLDVHMLAWKAGVKSLYYVRTEAASRPTDVTANAETNMLNLRRIQEQRAALAYEECAVCQ